MMRSASGNALLMLVTAVAAIFLSRQHAAAGSQYVIISATPASDELPLGKVFVPRDIISVPAGTVVTLLGEDGSVNSISGPSTAIVSADTLDSGGSPRVKETSSKLALIAGFLANERQRTESMGGSRGADDLLERSRLVDPWTISIEESAPGCIHNRQLVLTRHRAGESVVFSVRFDGGQPLNGLVWDAGKATYSLREPIPPRARELTIETNKKSTRIEIKTISASADLANPVDVLGWMIASGCKRQALAFARQLARKAN